MLPFSMRVLKWYGMCYYVADVYKLCLVNGFEQAEFWYVANTQRRFRCRDVDETDYRENVLEV